MLLLTSCSHEVFLYLKSKNGRPSFDRTMYLLSFFGKRRLSFTCVPLRCHSQTGRSLRRKKEETVEVCRNRVLASKHWHGSLSVHLCWCHFYGIIIKVCHFFVTIGIGLQMKNKTILLFSASVRPIRNYGNSCVERERLYPACEKMKENREGIKSREDMFVCGVGETTSNLLKWQATYS